MDQQGQTGRQGEQGAAGVQGHQGVQGVQGQQGKGVQGEPGIRGERGKSGQPWRSKNVTGSFVLLTVIFVLIASFQVYEARERRQLNKRVEVLAIENHEALCSFKDDLEGRAKNTRQFIVEIQQGVRPPIPGISVADLRRSLAAQRSTIGSLVDLNCSKEEP